MSDKMPKTPAPTPVELSNGETVYVSAFTAYHFMFDERVDAAFVALKEIVQALLARAEATGEDIDMSDALFACRKPLKVLVEASLDKPREWYMTLDPTDMFKLAGAVYAVNAEQYAGKILEMLKPVVERLQKKETGTDTPPQG